HVLLSAPTGMGKPLAAFLPLLGPLLPDTQPAPFQWKRSGIRGLYVAPLKALVNDAARSVQAALDGIAASLPDAPGMPHLMVRTGDTPSDERRRLFDATPDVLLTTPESLAVLLSQPPAQAVLADCRWV